MFAELPMSAQRALLMSMYRDYASPAGDRLLPSVQEAIRVFYKLSTGSTGESWSKAKNAKSVLGVLSEWERTLEADPETGESYRPASEYSALSKRIAGLLKSCGQRELQGIFRDFFDSIQGSDDMFFSEDDISEEAKGILKDYRDGKEREASAVSSDETGVSGGQGGSGVPVGGGGGTSGVGSAESDRGGSGVGSSGGDLRLSVDRDRERSYGKSKEKIGAEGVDIGNGLRLSVSKDKDDNTLYACHSCSVGALEKMVKSGCMVNPSIAISDITQRVHDSFGKVRIFFRPEILIGQDTYAGDAWMPRYPETELRYVDEPSRKLVKELLNKLPWKEHKDFNAVLLKLGKEGHRAFFSIDEIAKLGLLYFYDTGTARSTWTTFPYPWRLTYDVLDALKDDNVDRQFRQWCKDIGSRIDPTTVEVIKGTDIPATSENISKWMNERQARYPSWQSRLFPRWQTLDEIRANKGRLRGDQYGSFWFEVDAEKVLKRVNDAIRSQLGGSPKTNYFHNTMLTRTDPVAYVEQKYGVTLPQDVADELRELRRKYIEERPTAYFETKMNRLVGLNEMAVIMTEENLDPDIVAALEAAGVKVYDGVADADVWKEVERVLDENNLRFSIDRAEGADDAGVFGAAARKNDELLRERGLAERQRAAEEVLQGIGDQKSRSLLDEVGERRMSLYGGGGDDRDIYLPDGRLSDDYYAVMYGGGGGDDDNLRLSVGRRRRELMDERLDAERPDLSAADRSALYSYLDTLNDTKLENAAFDWFAKGTISIPEDMGKVRQAVGTADNATRKQIAELRKQGITDEKTLQRDGAVHCEDYDSPMALMDAHIDYKIKAPRINPDEVKTLRNRKDCGNGLVIYDVDNSEESRKNMRAIIDTHYGADCNPWCLLEGDGDGNLTRESARMWRKYSKYPKRVAFQDGKLLAFYASDDVPRWWDRQDNSYEDGIPMTRKLPGDKLGRTATYSYDDDTGEWSAPCDIHKGDKKNGLYQEWSDDGKRITLEATYKGGKLDGAYKSFFDDGNPRVECTYNDGRLVGSYKEWWDKDTPYIECTYNKNGKYVGSYKSWHRNGNLEEECTYKNGRYVGSYKSWYEDGTPYEANTYNENGWLDGVCKTWHRNGNLEEECTFKNGRYVGSYKSWWANGNRRVECTYKNGRLDGVSREWHENGNPYLEYNYKYGRRDGVSREWYVNGALEREMTFKNGEENGLRRTWNHDGSPGPSFMFKDGRLVLGASLDDDLRLSVDDKDAQELWDIVGARDYARKELAAGERASIARDNAAFNSRLAGLSEGNANGVILSLGNPSSILLAAGVPDKPIRLYGNKLVKKARAHGFSPEELRDLVLNVQDPIAVFNNHGNDSNRSILTELRTRDGNFLVAVEVGKGSAADFNIVSSVFGKGDARVLNWLRQGLDTYVNKEKALRYLRLPAPIAGTIRSTRLDSAGKGSGVVGDRQGEVAEKIGEEGVDIGNGLRLSVSKDKDDNTLYACHSCSVDALAKMVKSGCMVNPSIAISDITQRVHDSFGKVRIFFRPEILVGQDTYAGDAWTARYPTQWKELSKDAKKIYKPLVRKAKIGRDVFSVDTEDIHHTMNWLCRSVDGGYDITSNHPYARTVKVLYFFDTGKAAKYGFDKLPNKASDIPRWKAATVDKMADLVHNYGADRGPEYEDYQRWAEELVKRLPQEEYVMGLYRDLPATPENVSLVMNENQSTHPHWRSRLYPRWQTLDEMRANKGRLQGDNRKTGMFEREADRVLQKAGAEIMRLTGRPAWVKKDYLGENDDIVAFLEQKYGVTLPQDLADELRELRRKYIEERPTAYFETKMNRLVGLNEMAAIVTEEKLDQGLKDALLAAGVKVYDGVADADVRKEVERVLDENNLRFSIDREEGADEAGVFGAARRRSDELLGERGGRIEPVSSGEIGGDGDEIVGGRGDSVIAVSHAVPVGARGSVDALGRSESDTGILFSVDRDDEMGGVQGSAADVFEVGRATGDAAVRRGRASMSGRAQEERVAYMLERLRDAKSRGRDEAAAYSAAVREVGNSLLGIRRAMTMQKNYDKSVVNRLSRLSREMLSMGLVSTNPIPSWSCQRSPCRGSTPLRSGASYDRQRRSAELKLRLALLSLARRLT